MSGICCSSMSRYLWSSLYTTGEISENGCSLFLHNTSKDKKKTAVETHFKQKLIRKILIVKTNISTIILKEYLNA